MNKMSSVPVSRVGGSNMLTFDERTPKKVSFGKAGGNNFSDQADEQGATDVDNDEPEENNDFFPEFDGQKDSSQFEADIEEHYNWKN